MSQPTVTPKHLWIVGVIALLWNMYGAFDYLMTQTQNEAYMGNFSQAQLDYFYSFPTWVEVFWALAVWGGVVGSILLLLRKCLAVPVFAVSLVSMVITAIYNYGLSNGMEVSGTGGFLMTVVIFFLALGLVIYSRAMQKRDVLT